MAKEKDVLLRERKERPDFICKPNLSASRFRVLWLLRASRVDPARIGRIEGFLEFDVLEEF